MANVQVGGQMPLAQARMIQQILASEGIGAELVHGHLPGQHCRLLVAQSDAPMAEVFLAASDAETEAETVCPACGEANPGTFGRCWSCQADLDGEPEASGPSAPAESLLPVGQALPVPAASTGALGTVPAWWLGLAVLLLVLTNLFWLFQNTRVIPVPDNPLVRGYRDDGRCIVEYWADGGIFGEYCDVARDGVYESVSSYSRDGRLVATSLDGDQDGVVERVLAYDRDGRFVGESMDNDGDGWFDAYTELLRSGRRVQWHDRDGDSVYEERRVFDADGNLLFLERDTPEGFRRLP